MFFICLFFVVIFFFGVGVRGGRGVDVIINAVDIMKTIVMVGLLVKVRRGRLN